jgi:hypothetical protein
MASLDDPAVIDKLVPGFATLLLGLGLSVVTKSLWQLTSQRNYLWFVIPASAVAYVLVYACYLRKPCTGIRVTHFLIVQGLAFFMVWSWLGAAFRFFNCGLDRSTPADVAANVVGLHQRKTAFVLKLSAPSAFRYAELVVEADVFHQARTGTPVVVRWHRGALGDGWCGRHAVQVAATTAP